MMVMIRGCRSPPPPSFRSSSASSSSATDYKAILTHRKGIIKDDKVDLAEGV
uniref:Uncharacterized protein n=1 Tax=Helianthus annuus TaxID=4232 RepID=A0A251SG81_HELAN